MESSWLIIIKNPCSFISLPRCRAWGGFYGHVFGQSHYSWMTEWGEGSELCWPLQTSGNKISLWYCLLHCHIFMTHIYLALLAICACLSCKAIQPLFPQTSKGLDSDFTAQAGQQCLHSSSLETSRQKSSLVSVKANMIYKLASSRFKPSGSAGPQWCLAQPICAVWGTISTTHCWLLEP